MEMKNNNIDKEDAEKNKVVSIFAYISILFVIPLFSAKDSQFAKYHANQGLILFLASLAVYIVGRIIPFLGPLVIIPIGELAVLIFAIIGIVNVLNLEMKPLPWIGQFNIIK